MDTDDLSSMAYNSLLIAEQITHSFTIDLGAMSSQFNDEDLYLHNMLKLVRQTKDHPLQYIQYWDLASELSAEALRNGMTKLEEHLLKTLATPRKDRC